jgi:hypothetical protein
MRCFCVPTRTGRDWPLRQAMQYLSDLSFALILNSRPVTSLITSRTSHGVPAGTKLTVCFVSLATKAIDQISSY